MRSGWTSDAQIASAEPSTIGPISLTSPSRRTIPADVAAFRRSLRRYPHETRTEARRYIRGRQAARSMVIKQAVAESEAFEVPGVRTTHGAKRAPYRRSVVELIPERPAERQTVAGPQGDDFKRERERLGYSQAGIARALGISPGLVWFVERGERTLTHHLALLLADLPPASDRWAARRAAGVAKARPQVIKHLKTNGPTTKAQLRAKLGYSPILLEAIKQLITDEEIHPRRMLVTQHGRKRQRDVLVLGRRPPEKRGPLSGPRVEDLRCGAGVTRSELAAELGISRPTLAAHESGDRLLLAETTDRIPAALRAILRKRHEHTKELAGELLAVLRKHPEGISRKAWERELDQGSYGVPAAIAYLESSEAAYPFRTSRGTFYASEPWPNVTAVELVTAREANDLSQREAAELVDELVPCAQAELCAVERGGVVSPKLRRALRDCIDWRYAESRARRLDKLEKLLQANEPVTRERLGRELADRSERTQRDLDVLLADNRAHVDSIWVRAKGGGTRAVEGLRAGPALPQPSPIEDLGVALRSRELSRPRFAQLLKDVGGYPKVLSKTTIAFWCEGTDEPDPAALRAMAAVLAKLPPLEHPRTLSLKPLTDAELDEAVVTAVYLLPGRIKTQLTKSLPQGETRRRLQAVDRMAAAGRIIGRLGHTPPDALGRVFERTCYWPPDAKEAFASPDSKGLTAHVDLAAELRRRGLSARTFASLLTDRGYTISRGAAERWCKKSLLLDPEAQSAIDALLAEIPPLKNPLPLSAKPITDAELDGAVVVGVLKDPGRTKTQVAGSLPQGASQRRLAAVDRMAKAGRIVPRRGVAPPNAGGKVLAHDYYWPPGDIELTTNLTTTAAD